MSEEIFKTESIYTFTQHDVENKQLKEGNEKLRKKKIRTRMKMKMNN